MSIDLADYKSGASEAVRVFWGNRQAARQKQIDGGRADQGERAGVTAGKNMDGFLSLATEVVKANGLANAGICLNRSVLTLPGYFRSTKRGRRSPARTAPTHQGGEPMKGDENIVRVETLDDFDRELARDGGEALEVPASLAEEYGLFSEDVGSEDEIRDAGEDPHGPEEEDR